MKEAAAYPGTDSDSDHNLVVMKVKVRLKRVQGAKKIPRWNRGRLRSESGIKFSEDLDKQRIAKIAMMWVWKTAGII